MDWAIGDMTPRERAEKVLVDIEYFRPAFESEDRPVTKGQAINARIGTNIIKFCFGAEPLAEACFVCGEPAIDVLFSDLRKPSEPRCDHHMIDPREEVRYNRSYARKTKNNPY